MSSPIHLLGPTDAVPGREFARPARTLEDLDVLTEMAARIRRRGTRSAQPRWRSADGSSNWLVVSDWPALDATRTMSAVGFFGQARVVDHTPIAELESALVARAGSFAGLLAYYNVQLPGGRYGNLVLFDHPGARLHVRDDPAHGDAIRRTPQHYHSIRLHIGSFPEGIHGELLLERTRYFDFDCDPAWQALREPAQLGT
jgi:hypothetical protein